MLDFGCKKIRPPSVRSHDTASNSNREIRLMASRIFGLLSPGMTITSGNLEFVCKPPAWMYSMSITFDLQFANATFPGGEIRILPGTLQFQNQVLLDSSFMVTCANGDAKLISQHLNDRTGHVGDRAMCCGKTPLLVCCASSSRSRKSY